MIQISGGKSALWWEQKRQMRGGKSDKLGGGKSDKGKWTTAKFPLHQIWYFCCLGLLGLGVGGEKGLFFFQIQIVSFCILGRVIPKEET